MSRCDRRDFSRRLVRKTTWLLSLTVAGMAGATAPQELQAQGKAEWVVPERRAKRRNPVPTGAAAISSGREVYRKECRSCHGMMGRGDGPKAAELDSRVPDMTSEKVQGQSDGALFWKITEGRGDMPSAKTALSEEERWMVVHYLRSLAKTPSAGGKKDGR